MELYSIENFHFTYQGAAGEALGGVNLTVNSGDFVLLCGTSGCGKTTLLRHMKRALAPHGQQSGRILYKGTPISALDDETAAFEIGFVMQNPDEQIVCDKVYKELAFGLESMGVENGIIRRRVAEIASFLGLGSWFTRDCATLSGGQKQILNLASVMVMQPEVILLDEPTAQLDPIAAMEFIEVIKRINRELSMTIVLSEHRLDDVFGAATQVIVMEQGRLLCGAPPKNLMRQMRESGIQTPVAKGFPAPVQVYGALGGAGECPVDVREGRLFLEGRIPDDVPPPPEQTRKAGPEAMRVSDVFFKYEKSGADVLKGLDLSVYAGEVLCVLGANAAGKSTALSVMAGVKKPYRGRVKCFEKQGEGRYTPALLPQSPAALFLYDTVWEDLVSVGGAHAAEAALSSIGILHLKDRNPLDLSGGEMQKAALAKLLLAKKDVLLLDEPTKGLDAPYKEELAALLHRQAKEGKAVVLASHDVEFAARYADRCVMLFDGCVMSQDTPRRFFSENNYYTTSANKMVRHKARWALTAEDVIWLCKRKQEEKR